MSRLALASLIVITFASCVTSQRSTTVGDFRFLYYSKLKTFQDAEAFCKCRDGWLAEPRYLDIDNSLLTLRNDRLWIGLTRTTDGWRWGDGNQLKYSNWAPNQNSSLQMNCSYTSQNGWMPASCLEVMRFACQFDTKFDGNYDLQFITNSSKTHEEAVAACNSAGSRLVDVKSSVLNNMIKEQLKDQITFHTSGNDIQQEGVWRWGDGCEFDENVFQDWMNQGSWIEPNGKRKENCLVIIDNKKPDYWFDVTCSQLRNYVCQKDVDSGPCKSELCSSMGNCTRRNRRYSCKCNAGRYGPKCEKDFCVPSPCHNSGTCQRSASPPYYECYCPPEYTGSRCSEYSFIEKDQCAYHVHDSNRARRFYYKNAKTFCKNLGGTLAMVKSLEIQETIEMQMVNQYGVDGFKQFWIGGEKRNGIWSWVDDTQIPQTGPNQKWSRQNGDRMITSSYRSRKLNDTLWFAKSQGDYLYGFVCEKAVRNPCDGYCLNNGTCDAVGCQARCSCPSEYFGEKCENKKIEFLNISTEVSNYDQINITCVFHGNPVPDVMWVWRQNEILKNISEENNKNFISHNYKMSRDVIGSLIVQQREFLKLTEIGCYARNGLMSTKIEYTLPNSDMHFERRFTYLLGNYSVIQPSASVSCASAGWKLLQIPDDYTQQSISQRLLSWNVENDVYIDLKKQLIQNSVVWVQSNGSMVYNETAQEKGRSATVFEGKYVAWGQSQPSSSNGDCVVLKKSDQWRWAAVNCSHLAAYICERPVIGPMKNFQVDATHCKAEIVVNFTSGDLVKSYFHLLEVTKNSTGELVHANYILPRKWGNNPVVKQYEVENETKYTVKVIVCPDCPSPYKTSTQTTTDVLVSAEERPIRDFNVSRNGSSCVLNWGVNKIGVTGFTITAIENPKVLYGNSVAPINLTERLLKDQTTFLATANPNSVYTFAVRAQTCYGFGPVSHAQGNCETDTAAPRVIPTPQLMPKDKDNKNIVLIGIQVPDQRNGPISCIFVIVIVNSTANYSVGIVDIGTIRKAMTSSSAENLSPGENYLAMAITRNSSLSGTLQVQLGDGATSECDTSNAAATFDGTRIKRSLPQNTVEARNRRLDGWTNYSFIVATTTPGESDIYVKASEPVSFSLQKSIVNNTSFPVALVIGILVGILALLVLIFVIVIIRQRKASKIHLSSNDATVNALNEGSDFSFTNMALDVISDASTTRISLDNLLSVYNEMLTDDSKKFQEQFSNLTTEAKDLSYPTLVASSPTVKKKNRYKNVIPADHSRVVIGDSEYINASYIHGFRKENRYIAAQGPLPDTIEQFWYMVVEQKSTLIVMLTKCVEGKKKKCAQYWPAVESVVSFGAITVQNLSEKNCGSFAIRTLKVAVSDQSHTVTQVHFVAWPDHGVPATTTALLECHRAASKFISDAPVIVHCSAGVGRSGAYISYDILKSEGVSTGTVDVYKCILKMRENRIDMVQTANQYKLVHKLLVENHLFGETSLSTEQLLNGYNWKEASEKEFHNLSMIGPLNQDVVIAKNPAFNRDAEVIPYRRNRVTIVMKNDEVAVPYINASYVEVFDPNVRIIATQGPLASTQDMLWRCVLDNNVKTILCLTAACEDKEEQSTVYWPEEQHASIAFNDITVQLGSVETKQNTICRHIGLRRNDATQAAVHFQYLGWKSKQCPTDPNDILDLVEKLSSRVDSEPDASVLVHCSDGAGRTGTFCAIFNLISRLKADQSIDVFRTAKDLRDCRPKMIRTLDEYRFCYQALIRYLCSNRTGVNVNENGRVDIIYENMK